MLKNGLLLVLLCCTFALYGQEITTPYKNRKITTERDTIQIDSVSINKVFFKLQDKMGNDIDTSYYDIDFRKSTLVFKNGFRSPDTLTMRYLSYPDYLTKKYSIYEDSRVVANDADDGNRYTIARDPLTRFQPFEGLNTSGSITRGITMGNNQNAVVNSNLDLQITGKISQRVSLRASIQDSNIPLQEGGYSQKLDEFDQIFIEMFSDNWNIRAGDLFLENRESRFLNFNKKVQGLSTAFSFGKPEARTTIHTAAALVRGQYARSTFTGQEGNQGPYKLRGANQQSYILVISGSERVFVNGILLERGESNDYIIDYNAGEIIFTTLFPITSEMRINIEYQYSERSYTRFVSYGGITHENDGWSIGGYVYSENDIKNQPLQQNLSEQQVETLKQAGDDNSLMTAPSAYVDTYSENKILYRKTIINGFEVFEYSNNPDDELYNVTFSLVGNNQGNYVLSNTDAIGRIYEYAPPVGGVLQGNYEPITRLTPPTKIQIATVLGKYNPSEKTYIDFETGLSNNDLNLYSPIDDDDNNGFAGNLNAKQRLYTSEAWELDVFGNFQYVQKDFRTIERLYNIEFNRDWNLDGVVTMGANQSFLIAGTTFRLPQKGQVKYQAEQLDFSNTFSGTRHVVDGMFTFNKLMVKNQGSWLESDSDYASSTFIRNEALTKYHVGKNWVGGSFRMENNEEKIKATGEFSALSQRFNEVGAFVGRGDSTKVYVEVGYLQRANDSLVAGALKKVNTSHSYYLKSRLVQTEKSDLTLFVNYRELKFEDPAIRDEPSLNSRVLYNDSYWNQLVQVTTAYETTSGTIAQQEFTYLEVEPGQGVYMWNDYNENGIQELQEFEVAPFPDQAKYVRVFLANQIFVRTHQNKFSQSLTLNPTQWQNAGGVKKFLSYFYNQSSFLIDRKIERDGGNFDLNPFSSGEKNLLGITSGIRNSLFYNRGKQDHSVTYTYTKNRTKTLLTSGSQENDNNSHQLQYAHLLQKTWLFGLTGQMTESSTYSENYGSRNYEIDSYLAGPKISYIFSRNASWDIFYEYRSKENRIGDAETLYQQRLGTSFTYASEKQFTTSGEFSFYKNDFTGNQLSPAAFQMLEGLQAGENLTWRLLLQKNLTQFLDVNVSYQGRKSETSKAIHTGSVQLRAYF
ncbi:hypothetical protein E0W68_12790 [Flavobacterium salilacus subsp. salilacus]|uniref:hypothetical protein n=1 Tax=Flavobacterium TaxID=237 RepID=UPI00107542AE|nr:MULTISPECIES: hypothetical protein [Flavobacterium]KAF2515822.1 hypothetical protein E0W68_12790 [Flavobacterium salilacus subsp. salilacus]MBE1615374.1 hypothetical protein [Flavobacterium sp. SaA2.13]